MKKCIIIVSTLVLCLSSYMQARDISPTFSIRYEDFINSASPSAAIGLKLESAIFPEEYVTVPTLFATTILSAPAVRYTCIVPFESCNAQDVLKIESSYNVRDMHFKLQASTLGNIFYIVLNPLHS